MPIADVFASSTGGGTTIISDGKAKLVAALDFTTMSTTSLSTDGDYTLATTSASSVTSLTVKVKNMANNVGGIMDVASGKLTITIPTTITSTFGTGYWSTLHSPLIAIDMRQFADILADVNLQKWDLIMDVEHEQIYTTANAIPVTVGNCELNLGFTVGMSTYFSAATVPVKWYYNRLRSDASFGTPAGDGSYYWGANFKTNATGQGGDPNNSFKLNSAPFSSLYTGGPTKSRNVYNAYGSSTNYYTSTLTEGYRYYNSGQINGPINQDWNYALNTNVGAFRTGNTNDIWATITPMRSGGSGATNFKITKISFYIRERV